MNWFYKQSDRELGPVSAATLQELAACGVIANETLVRKADSADWIAYFETSGGETSDGEEVDPVDAIVRFHCPGCGQKISAGKEDAGKQAECPACGLVLIVPTITEDDSGDHSVNHFSKKSQKLKLKRLATFLAAGGAFLILMIAGMFVAKRGSSGGKVDTSITAENPMIRRLLEWPIYTHYDEVKESPDAILKAIHPLASNGDSVAQYVSLIICYEEKKTSEEKKWLSELTSLASGGNAEAQYYLSLYYKRINDNAERMEWLTRSLQQDFVPAQIDYGQSMIEGSGISRDKDAGFHVIKKSAESGQPCALAALGSCYLYEHGTEMDTEKAITLFNEASDKGYPWVAIDLFRIYNPHIDYGVARYSDDKSFKNSDKAIEWLQRAIECDPSNYELQKDLGDFFANGQLVGKDEAKAVYWWKKSVENGNDALMYLVGICYKNGFGVEKNSEISADWIRKAAEKGYDKPDFDFQYLAEVAPVMPEGHYTKVNKEFVKSFNSRHQIAISASDLPIERLLGAVGSIESYNLADLSPDLKQAVEEVKYITTGYTGKETARRIDRFLALCKVYE